MWKRISREIKIHPSHNRQFFHKPSVFSFIHPSSSKQTDTHLWNLKTTNFLKLINHSCVTLPVSDQREGWEEFQDAGGKSFQQHYSFLGHSLQEIIYHNWITKISSKWNDLEIFKTWNSLHLTYFKDFIQYSNADLTWLQHPGTWFIGEIHVHLKLCRSLVHVFKSRNWAYS